MFSTINSLNTFHVPQSTNATTTNNNTNTVVLQSTSGGTQNNLAGTNAINEPVMINNSNQTGVAGHVAFGQSD